MYNQIAVVSKICLCFHSGSSWCMRSPLDTSQTPNFRDLLSFVDSRSLSSRGRAWSIVGAQGILMIKSIIPSLRFFLPWASMCECEQIKYWIVSSKLRWASMGIEDLIHRETTHPLQMGLPIKHRAQQLEWVLCSDSLPADVLEPFKWDICSASVWAWLISVCTTCVHTYEGMQ